MQLQAQAVPAVTLIDRMWPERRVLHNVLLVLAFTVIIALSARVSFPLPFSPVPFSLQTLTVLLAGVLLGSRLGMLTIVAYLAEGIAGLPVFALGLAGPAVLVGPTAGYLIGFMFAAGLVGYLAERGWDRRVWTTLLAMVLGNLVIYAFGVSWLSYLLGSVSRALAGGVLPFLIGDAVKIALAVAILPGAWKLLQKR